MTENEEHYIDLLVDILDHGIKSEDRTGVGTLSVFGRQLRFDLKTAFPLLTTKKVAWKPVVSELLWFIEGSGDERRLAEILYDKPREELADKTTIWTANAQAPYWKPKAKFDGDCGRPYGVQWRNWLSLPTFKKSSLDESPNGVDIPVTVWQTTDQLKQLIEGIKKDPNGRRHILSAWNPGELDQMVLPPCHVLSQYYVRNGELSCHLFIRSWDVFLGGPFNIASYALLTRMIAQVCDLKAAELVISVTDAHLYLNHLDQVHEQLKRDIVSEPTLYINPDVKSLFDFKMSDFVIEDYDHQGVIKGRDGGMSRTVTITDESADWLLILLRDLRRKSQRTLTGGGGRSGSLPRVTVTVSERGYNAIQDITTVLEKSQHDHPHSSP